MEDNRPCFFTVPSTLTVEALSDGLRFSLPQRRKLRAALMLRDRDFWGTSSVEENRFYAALREYVGKPGKWATYEQVAIRVQKRKRSLLIGASFFRTTTDDLFKDSEFVSIWPELRDRDDAPVEVVRYLLEHDQLNRAVNLAWAISPDFPKKIAQLVVDFSELADALDLAPDSSLPRTEPAQTENPTIPDIHAQPQTDWPSHVRLMRTLIDHLYIHGPNAEIVEQLQIAVNVLRDQCISTVEATTRHDAANKLLAACLSILNRVKSNPTEDKQVLFCSLVSSSEPVYVECELLAKELGEAIDSESEARALLDPLDVETQTAWNLAAQRVRGLTNQLLSYFSEAKAHTAALPGDTATSKQTLGEPSSARPNPAKPPRELVVTEETESRANASDPPSGTLDEVTEEALDGGSESVESTPAAADSGPSNVDNHLPEQQISSILWLEQHLRAGRLAEAYWLAWSREKLEQPTEIASALLGAAAAARAQVPGEVPSAESRGFLSTAMELNLDSVDSILASAAVMPIAVLSPQPAEGVFTLASQLRTGLPSLDELIEEVTSNCLHQGLFLTWSTIRETDPTEEHDSRIKFAQAQATEFMDHLPHLSITWRPAAEAFRDIFREGQPLRRALKAVRDDSSAEFRWVESLMEDFDSESLLDELRNNRRIRGRSLPQIQGTARQKLLHHFEQFKSIVETWLGARNAIQHEVSHSDVRALTSFKRRLIGRLSTVIDELTELKDEPGLKGGVLYIAAETLRRLQSTLAGSAPPEPEPLEKALLRVGAVHLPADLSAPEEPEQIEILKQQLESDSTTQGLAELVEITLSRGEFARALALSRESPDDALRVRVESRIEASVVQTRERLQEAETAVEDAYLLGLLKSDDSALQSKDDADTQPSRSVLMAKLYEARQVVQPTRPPSAVELAQATTSASSVLDSVQRLKDERESQYLNELNTLVAAMHQGSDADKEDADYLASQAERFRTDGDVIALGELVSQATTAQQNGTRIDRITASARERLNDFLAKDESLGRDWNKAEALANVVRKQGRIGPVSFGDKDLAYCERAAQAFRYWGQLTVAGEPNKRKESQSAVTGLLSFMGFPVQPTNPPTIVSSDAQFLHVKVDLSEAVTISPIPAFGSAAFPKLDVVVCPSKVQARVLADFLKRKGLVRTPVIVLHRPAITRSQRLELRNFAIRMHLSALLVDFSLFLYAAGSRDPLPTVLEMGLPFLWSQPYQMKGDLVPREVFVGRADAIRSVSEPDGTSVVFGGRQLGKSALLRHVKAEFHDPAASTYVVYRDIDDLGTSQSFEDMEAELWRRIAEELGHAGFIEGEVPQGRRKERVADAVQRSIREKFEADPACRLIVLLDEADDLLDVDAGEDFRLTKQIRSLMGQTHRRFKVVFAGLQSVQRFYSYKNHPFAQLGSGYPITPLPPGAARDLVVEPLRTLGFEFAEPSLVYRILSQSNYHPGLVQIFCFRLLERLYNDPGSPKDAIREIQRQDVIAIERDREFQAEIRERFDWTLDLDDRYKVLIYALVLSDDPTGSLTETDFLELGRIWWPSVFDEVDHQTARSLLDELAGLGVLTSEVYAGSLLYRLRSPNLLRLLGPRERIEADLNQLISRSSARKPNPRHFRKLLDAKEITFSPLTLEQGAQLVRGDHYLRVVLVQGSVPLGLQAVPGHVDSVLGDLKAYGEVWESITIPVDAVARGSQHLVRTVANHLKPQQRHHKYAVIDTCGVHDGNSIPTLINGLLGELPKLCRQRSRGLIVVLLDSAATWSCMGDRNFQALLTDERVSLIALRRWSDGSLAKALEDLNRRSRAKDNGEIIFAATEGIHVLCEFVFRDLKGAVASTLSKEQVAEIVQRAAGDLHLLINTGSPALEAAINRIQELAPDGEAHWDSAIGLLQEEAPIVEQVLHDGGLQFRAWLQATGLIGPIGRDGKFRICGHLRAKS